MRRRRLSSFPSSSSSFFPVVWKKFLLDSLYFYTPILSSVRERMMPSLITPLCHLFQWIFSALKILREMMRWKTRAMKKRCSLVFSSFTTAEEHSSLADGLFSLSSSSSSSILSLSQWEEKENDDSLSVLYEPHSIEKNSLLYSSHSLLSRSCRLCERSELNNIERT